MNGKLIIISAPSGSGKSTIISYLLKQNLNLEFSISATNRLPRGKEKDGIDYYFLSTEEFKKRITNGDFFEYEEVYEDRFYGTLKSEVERILAKGHNVIMDLDVVGGYNVKNIYKEKALAIFIQPPSVEALEQRLKERNTDSPEVIAYRIKKAEHEMEFAKKFDKIIFNDNLENAQQETKQTIKNFLTK